jgi:hypothetical protein
MTDALNSHGGGEIGQHNGDDGSYGEGKSTPFCVCIGPTSWPHVVRSREVVVATNSN